MVIHQTWQCPQEIWYSTSLFGILTTPCGGFVLGLITLSLDVRCRSSLFPCPTPQPKSLVPLIPARLHDERAPTRHSKGQQHMDENGSPSLTTLLTPVSNDTQFGVHTEASLEGCCAQCHSKWGENTGCPGLQAQLIILYCDLGEMCLCSSASTYFIVKIQQEQIPKVTWNMLCKAIVGLEYTSIRSKGASSVRFWWSLEGNLAQESWQGHICPDSKVCPWMASVPS